MPESACHPPPGRQARIGTLFRIVAAAVVVLLIITGLFISRPTEYATGIGEQRTVTLADGTSIKLDAVSRIRVLYNAHKRTVTLLEGQAFFCVAKDAARPFVVVSGATRVRDVGTQFDIERSRFRTIVTVVEGRVSVSYYYHSLAASLPILAPMRTIEVDAGEQIMLTPHMIPRLEPADLSASTAWTHNELIFDSTPLPQVAAEFNRLNARQLLIEGGRLQDFHISGEFPALDPTSLPRFIKFLRAQPDIRVIETGDRIIVTEK